MNVMIQVGVKDVEIGLGGQAKSGHQRILPVMDYRKNSLLLQIGVMQEEGGGQQHQGVGGGQPQPQVGPVVNFFACGGHPRQLAPSHSPRTGFLEPLHPPSTT